MNITTKLRKAKGDENSMELYDIMQPIDFRNDRQVLAENVEYTLKREKLLPRGYSVLIPVGGIVEHRQETGRETGFIQGDFEIFAPDMDTIVAYGTTYGSIMAGELMELTTEITEVTGNVGRPVRKRKTAERKEKKAQRSLKGLR